MASKSAPAKTTNKTAIRFPTLDEKLCFALYSSSLAMLQAYKPALASIGLTYTQYLVMLVLWEGDGVTIKHLAERLELDSGSVTPLVKRLEEAGFVVRSRVPTDERNLSVVLTREGRALQQKAEEVSNQFVTACNLSFAKGMELKDALATLARTLRRNE